jgi:hypothetical protein
MEDLSDVLVFLDPKRRMATNREVQSWHTKSREWPSNQPRLRIAGELLAMSSLRQGKGSCALRVRVWHAHHRELNFEGPGEGAVLEQLGAAFDRNRLGLDYPYLTVLRLDVEAPRPVDVRAPYAAMEYKTVTERTYWFFGQKDEGEFRQACIDVVDTGLLALIYALPAASLDD